MLEDEFTLYIYTDGSTYYHLRRSGVGILFLYSAENGKERIYELDETGYKGGTIVEMEIKACTIALTEAARNDLFSKYKNVVIYSDSQFVIDNYKRAELIWSRNKWKLSSGAPVVNTAAWKDFVSARKKLGKPVEIHKVKAHSKNIHNNRADKLAKKSAKLPVKKSSQVVQVTRKISKKYTEKGSVKVNGQIIQIHIIQRQYLHEHKIDRYRYEVVNEDSKYFDCVDFIYSEFHLKRNHFYEVRVNDNQEFPQVLEVIREIERPVRSNAEVS
ncbi:MAG: RNase H family protein [Chloroflexota bacterium]